MNTAQRQADHLPGGRQERSESANALERRFVAQGGTTDEHRKFPVQRFRHSKHTHYLFVFFVGIYSPPSEKQV